MEDLPRVWPETDFEKSVSNVPLDSIHSVLELLRDGLTPKRLHIEVTRLGWKD